jgi:hypothetical protein
MVIGRNAKRGKVMQAEANAATTENNSLNEAPAPAACFSNTRVIRPSNGNQRPMWANPEGILTYS